MLKLKTPKKWLALILILLADAVAAHEFWLEPLSYHINPGDRVKVHIKVGQHFSGNTQPYLPDKSEKFNLELSGRPVDVTPRIGDIPALNLPLEDRGLALLSYVSTDYILEYRDPGRFEAFLEYDLAKLIYSLSNPDKPVVEVPTA